MNQLILCDDSCDCSCCRADTPLEYRPPIVPMIDLSRIPVTISVNVLEGLIKMATSTYSHREPDKTMLEIAKNAAQAAKELTSLYNGECEFTN